MEPIGSGKTGALIVTHSGRSFVNRPAAQAGNTRSRCWAPRPKTAQRRR